MIGLFYIFVSFLCCNLVTSSVVKLENNAYKGIVIAIDDTIHTNQQEIISAIKDMFKSGSSFLYTATGKRAYFGEVTILLPKHWTLPSDTEESGTESFDSADIRVTFPNTGRFNNMSFTMYQEECGKGGKFIHMNLGHLLKTEPELITRTLYGEAGRWLTKHWAMYRYGIYEEHGLIGSDKFRTFYNTPHTARPTGCASQEHMIYGTVFNFLTGQGGCDLDEKENRPSKYCYYSSVGDVNDDGDQISSSIAYDHTNKYVHQFCGDGDNARHQDTIPTPHNYYCKNQSTWSVIMQHNDFKNNKNSPRDVKDTTPKFRFVTTQLHERFVMVIDTSASMNKNHLRMVNTAFESAVMNHLPFRSSFGVVVFNETARVLYEMKTIDEIEDKQIIINRLPTTGEGSTCIACGLEKAIEMIENSNPENPKSCLGTKIILLTDGNENEVNRTEDVLDRLKEKSVRIFPIAYGNYADAHLEDLSKETNGFTCFIPKTNKTTADDFYDCISPIFGDDDPSTANVMLNVNKKNSDSKRDDLPCNQFLCIDKIHTPIDLKMVKVEGWMNVNGEMINATKQRVSVYAYVHIKNAPVENINVYAEISRPTGTKTVIQLNDNGIQPDMVKGDGVYSRYFLDFIGNGRYAVKLVLNETVEPTPKSLNSKFLAGSLPTHEKRIPVGSFKVTDKFIHSVKNDIYPPNAIEDLNIVHYDNITHKITLNWTAPGNDFDIGQAVRYELKYHHECVELQQSFDIISNQIKQSDLLSGNLTPNQSGNKEIITWRVPESFVKEYYSLSIAIRAVDQNDNYAALSNIAIARIRSVLCRKVGNVFAHHSDCTSYLICEWEKKPPTIMKCPFGTTFDRITKHCEWNHKVKC